MDEEFLDSLRRINSLLTDRDRWICLMLPGLLLETSLLQPTQHERETTRDTADQPSLCHLSLTTGAMVPAVLKLYFIGTALSVLAVLYGLMDSFGGLMYVQDPYYILDMDQQTQRQLSSSNQRSGSPVTKNIDS